jgi:hypothetical protein
MSDEQERLGDETVHGVKNVWQRFDRWSDEMKDEESEPEVPVPEPEPQPEPEPEPAPVPPPEPPPIPKPEPKPEPPKVEMDNVLVSKMGHFLKRRDGLSWHDAVRKIKGDPALYEELKNLKRW